MYFVLSDFCALVYLGAVEWKLQGCPVVKSALERLREASLLMETVVVSMHGRLIVVNPIEP